MAEDNLLLSPLNNVNIRNIAAQKERMLEIAEAEENEAVVVEEEKIVTPAIIGVQSDYSDVDVYSMNPQEIAEAYAEKDEEALVKHEVVLAQRNADFDVDAFYAKGYDDEYVDYEDQRTKAYAAGDYDTVNQWDAWYGDVKEKRNTFDKFNECTIDNNCEEGNADYYNITKNAVADWKYTDQVNNTGLLKSLRRTYGSYSFTGEKLTNKNLVDMWMSDQAFSNVNLTKMGFDAASMLGMTEQQKKDFALQFTTYGKIAPTGEGSRDGFTQTIETLGGLIADPGNWGVLATFGITLLPKEAARAGAKQGIKHYINKFLASNTLRTGSIAGTYTGLDNLARQSIKIQADLQDNLNWGEFIMMTGFGFGLGGTMGALLGGASNKFNDLATKYMIKNKIGDRAFLQTIRDNITDEKSLYKFLKNLGWTRKEAKEEITQLHKQGFKFDEAETRC